MISEGLEVQPRAGLVDITLLTPEAKSHLLGIPQADQFMVVKALETLSTAVSQGKAMLHRGTRRWLVLPVAAADQFVSLPALEQSIEAEQRSQPAPNGPAKGGGTYVIVFRRLTVTELARQRGPKGSKRFLVAGIHSLGEVTREVLETVPLSS